MGGADRGAHRLLRRGDPRSRGAEKAARSPGEGGSEGSFARAAGGRGRGLAGSPRTAEGPRTGLRCGTRGWCPELGRCSRVHFPMNRPRGDGPRGGPAGGGRSSLRGGGRYLRSRRGPGTGHLGWAPHTFSAACGRGEPSSPALRADSEGARVQCRVRRAKVGAQWVRRGVCQGVRGAHASPSSTEGRLEVGALGALEGCWAATWE